VREREDFREHAAEHEHDEQREAETDVQGQDDFGMTVAILKTMAIGRTMRRCEERIRKLFIHLRH